MMMFWWKKPPFTEKFKVNYSVSGHTMNISQEDRLKTDVLGRSCNSILIPGGLAGRDHISFTNSVVTAQRDGFGESHSNSVTCSSFSTPGEAVFLFCPGGSCSFPESLQFSSIPAAWEAAAEQPELGDAVWMPAVSSSLLLDGHFIIDLLLQY